MRIVQRYGDIEHMAAHHTPRCVIIRGGDEYLNRLAARRHARQWLDAHPDSELIELEAKDSNRYDFEEATSPSLLSPSAAVIVNHAEDCDEPLAQAITDHCRNPHGEADGSLVISLTNVSVDKKKEVAVEINKLLNEKGKERSLKDVTARILSCKNITDYNDFEHPDRVKTEDFKDFKLKKNKLTVKIPAKSIVVLEVK